LRGLMAKCDLTSVRKLGGAKRFEPSLPTPAPSAMRRISFLRHQDDVALVAIKFLEDSKAKPADVGAACFDEILKKVSR
jgi:hypothetical protein